jgi:hypothetical protein
LKEKSMMRQNIFVLFAVATLAGLVSFTATASRNVDEEAAPIFVKEIPAGYRDWRLISVAHEEGELIAQESSRSRKAPSLPG